MIRRIILMIGLFLFSAGSAFAAHPLISDDTGTQGKGKLQLEINGEVGRDKESSNGVQTKTKTSEMATSVSVGVADSVDFVVGVPWAWNRVKEDGVIASDENGLGDMSLELKWRFFEHKGFSLAVKPGVDLPTGNENKGLGTGKVAFKGALIASQELEPFTFHVNAAYARYDYKLQADEAANRRDIYHLSMATQYEVMKGLQLVANVGAETNTDTTSRMWPAFILGGVIYSPTENFDVDFGVKGGLNSAETDLTVMAGVAFRF